MPTEPTEATTTIEVTEVPSWWERLITWWNSLPWWKKTLIATGVVVGVSAPVAYAVTRRKS